MWYACDCGGEEGKICEVFICGIGDGRSVPQLSEKDVVDIRDKNDVLERRGAILHFRYRVDEMGCKWRSYWAESESNVSRRW